MKKVTKLFFCLIMMCGLFTVIKSEVWAGEVAMTGVSISSEGVMTWDAFDGASEYCYIVGSSGGFVTDATINLFNLLESAGKTSGSYEVTLYAVDADRRQISAKWADHMDIHLPNRN